MLGVHSGREHWGVGPPGISTLSEYNTEVSGSFRQAGNNVALSRALLPVGTLIMASCRSALVRCYCAEFWTCPNLFERLS
jgi:hypothetical protein